MGGHGACKFRRLLAVCRLGRQGDVRSLRIMLIEAGHARSQSFPWELLQDAATMQGPWSRLWLAGGLAVAGALATGGGALALESLVTQFSFSMEGHCSAPRQGESRREDDYNVSEIILDEEDGQWLERVVTECFALKSPAMTPREAYETYQAAEESRCPGQSRWSVVLEEPHRLLFEQRRLPCAGDSGRLLLGLAIQGREDRWLITYSAREPVRDPADRQAFLDNLENVEVLTMTGPTQGVPTWGPTSGPAWVGRLARDREWSDGHDVVGPLPIPPGWALTQRMVDRGVWLWGAAFTPPGRGLDTAAEALMLTRVSVSNWNAQRHLDTVRADLEKRCGGKAALNVLVQEQDRIVTETLAPRCRKSDYEYRVTAYLAGSASVWKVDHVARKAADPAALREGWVADMLAIGMRPVAAPRSGSAP